MMKGIGSAAQCATEYQSSPGLAHLTDEIFQRDRSIRAKATLIAERKCSKPFQKQVS